MSHVTASLRSYRNIYGMMTVENVTILDVVTAKGKRYTAVIHLALSENGNVAILELPADGSQGVWRPVRVHVQESHNLA